MVTMNGFGPMTPAAAASRWQNFLEGQGATSPEWRQAADLFREKFVPALNDFIGSIAEQIETQSTTDAVHVANALRAVDISLYLT